MTKSAIESVAVHVVPWQCGVPEASRAGVIEGYWIKLADFGGTYIVKLHDRGTLTEWHIFDRSRKWSGRWWLGEPKGKATLCMWIDGWVLEVPLTEPTEAKPWYWPLLRDGKEVEPRRDRTTLFKVAHVRSG